MKTAKLPAVAGLLTLSLVIYCTYEESDYNYPELYASLSKDWVDGSDLKESDGTPDDVFSSEGRALLTVATTFPWGNP